MSNHVHARADELIREFRFASIGVIDEVGYPSVSAISLLAPQTISELYFSTTLDSNKAKRLSMDSRASVNCFNENANITLVGDAEIISDPESKAARWAAWVALGLDIYPGGVDDPNYCYVRFTTKRASLWIDDQTVEFQLD